MTTLAGITWDHARGYDSVMAVARKYRERTGVAVHWDVRSLQAFADHPLPDLLGRYDLLVVDHPHIAAVASAGLVLELGDTVEAIGASQRSYTYQGRQYGYAIDAAAQVSAHRPDQLTDPPTSWPDMLELARTGRVRWPAAPIDAYSTLLTLAAASGTPALREPGVFLPADQLSPVLAMMHELAALVPAGDLDHNPIQVAEILCGENPWCYSPLLFGYTNYSRVGYRSARLAYRDMPTHHGSVRGALLGGAGVVVSAATAHPGAARQLASFLADEQVQRGVYFDGGGQPAHCAAWADPVLDAATLGFFSGTRETLDGAYVRPRHPRYVQFQDLVSPRVTAALRGESTDAGLIEGLNDAAERLLTGN